MGKGSRREEWKGERKGGRRPERRWYGRVVHGQGLGREIYREWRRPGLSPLRKSPPKEKQSKDQKTPEDTMRQGNTGASDAVENR